MREDEYGWVSVNDLQINDNDFFIVPFNTEHARGGGYNLTATNVFLSVNSRLPLTIYQKKGETYTYIPAHDSALVLTREFISLGNNLCGSICSRVRTVAEGFGHISTSIDPGWNGQLLISLNNPSNRNLKFLISRENSGLMQYMPFATLRMQRFMGKAGTQSCEVIGDNPDARVDIMQTMCWKHNRPLNYLKHRQFQQVISIIKAEKITSNTVKPNENLSKLNRLKNVFDISPDDSYDQVKSEMLDVLLVSTDNCILKNQLSDIKEYYQSKRWKDIRIKLINAIKTCKLEEINQIVCDRNDNLERVTYYSWHTKPIENFALWLKFNYLKLFGYAAIILVLGLSQTIFKSLASYWADSLIPILAVLIAVWISQVNVKK